MRSFEVFPTLYCALWILIFRQFTSVYMRTFIWTNDIWSSLLAVLFFSEKVSAEPGRRKSQYMSDAFFCSAGKSSGLKSARKTSSVCLFALLYTDINNKKFLRLTSNVYTYPGPEWSHKRFQCCPYIMIVFSYFSMLFNSMLFYILICVLFKYSSGIAYAATLAQQYFCTFYLT